ncbi:carboxypeptidase regulatory-like domain-containing protein [Halomarina salina]|uniref:Carboxypeptidase regulatory-like domain-containing protein n=1 Tax=Halomarina salina TaxID=1872699 RepID=A0ABD5RJY4_9EURY|nr:carboxypeptidase regulatory-like domain-containing protein [Halomarina salina]
MFDRFDSLARFDPRDDLRRLRGDERAIEGLPIRLVIALVVGVASLGVMMQMLSGVSGLAVTELDTQPTPEVVTPGDQQVEVRVVTPEGRPVAGATVVAKADTARLDGVVTAETDTDGTATLDLAPTLGPNQADGTVTFDVKPPAGGEFVDRRANTRLLVVAEN